MPKGISLHIGLNEVDPTQYGGWPGTLVACENDARDMADLATSQGFTAKTLLTSDATASRVMQEIGEAAMALDAGDIFFLTYSGHGGQVPDKNGDEVDREDETWVLYNRMVLDDELYLLWSQFKAGVRIVVLSDSCHSGTMLKAMPDFSMRPVEPEATRRIKAIPDHVQREAYAKHKDMYTERAWANPRGDQIEIAASVLLISGCQDNQVSMDGDRNGLFTAKLLEVWNKGSFTGTYYRLYKNILKRMPADQTPNLFEVGSPSGLRRQNAFRIARRPPHRSTDGLEIYAVKRDADTYRISFEVKEDRLAQMSSEEFREMLERQAPRLFDEYRGRAGSGVVTIPETVGRE